MQRYYFFLIPPNILRKNCHFSVKKRYFSLLFRFCHFDFTKFGYFSHFKTSYFFVYFDWCNRTQNNHLYMFSTSSSSTLKSSVGERIKMAKFRRLTTLDAQHLRPTFKPMRFVGVSFGKGTAITN